MRSRAAAAIAPRRRPGSRAAAAPPRVSRRGAAAQGLVPQPRSRRGAARGLSRRWYSPGLAANDTHVVVDAASVEAVVEGLNADPKAAAALAAGAARVRRGLVCPDCALDYARRLLVAIRDRVWSSNLLDNAAALLAVVERADACGAFVEAAPAEFGDETLAEVGQGLCEFLRGVVAEVKAAEG